jgi:hypothetical protein
MKYINKSALFLLISLLIYSCENKYNKLINRYEFIKDFSEKIKQETELELTVYGINRDLPNEHALKNGIYNINITYWMKKNKNDEIPLEKARDLIVFVTENLLQEINSNPAIKSRLDFHPFPLEHLNIIIHFVDENKIDLGRGVAIACFSKGKIEYERYDIREYTNRYPAHGKHFTIHEESYAKALEIVKEQRYCKLRTPPARPISHVP